MNHVVIMQIIDSFQDLPNGLRGIFLGELAVFADSVEELASRGQLGDDVVLVLLIRQPGASSSVSVEVLFHTRDSNQS